MADDEAGLGLHLAMPCLGSDQDTLKRALESLLAARSARTRRGFSTVIPGPGVSFRVSGASALRCQPFLVAMATLAVAFSPRVALTLLGLTS